MCVWGGGGGGGGLVKFLVCINATKKKVLTIIIMYTPQNSHSLGAIYVHTVVAKNSRLF